MLGTILAFVALWLGASAATTQTIVFEVYELQAGGGRTLLGEGARKYSPTTDVKVIDQGETEFGHRWSKALVLFKTFEIEAQVYRGQSLDGFGLLIQDRGNPRGFSWEWFTQGKGDLFTKLQGPGRLKVALATSDGKVELAGVEFLEDITLRYKSDVGKGAPGTHTHEVVVKKGSVFSFPPPSRPTKE